MTVHGDLHRHRQHTIKRGLGLVLTFEDAFSDRMVCRAIFLSRSWAIGMDPRIRAIVLLVWLSLAAAPLQRDRTVALVISGLE
ncbi:uncharacterized protein GGS25DRAFT_519735 [Hypoxylon fragiforme]|uniref:uncharacterized protein n=1 Tax=Hypoxylon fragiforme TaxID=63214 RepID=UPI0020C6F2E1|nr:uncharacterized protein GGS25DRAFT_519735 [Hypoxylon fragiforme]KAI2611426.1 hypothetical protein GGS25DRAFT_519735 [Hypoxylon fragiforme]